MSQSPSPRHWGARRRWLAGVVAGAICGVAALVVDPVMVLPALLFAAALGLGPKASAGPAGVLMGFGGAWTVLLVNVSMMCATSDPPQCGWAMFPGSLWLRPAATWQTAPTDVSFAKVLLLIGVAIVLAIGGLAATAWAARRAVRGLSADRQQGPAAPR